MKKLAFISVALALAFSAPAKADLSAAYSFTGQPGSVATNNYAYEAPKARSVTKTKARKAAYTGTKVSVAGGRHHAGPKPGKWCGWWMRTVFGGPPEYNRARAWANRGTSAGGPRVGAVVVWPHHVGIITGRSANGQWIVKSGNDSNRVRERARSVSGAIAFRIV